MTGNDQEFNLYLTVLRFLVFKVSKNLRRIYLDIDKDARKMILTAFYSNTPSGLELELLDDIVTNSNAHIPDYYISAIAKLAKDFDKSEKHAFTVFADNEEL